MNINSLVLNIASYFISSARARCIVQPTPQACINKASCKLHRSDTKSCSLFSPVVTLEACYLVKWRLDSCTSISLLLKSLSSFRIAACEREKKKKKTRGKFEKSGRGLAHQAQPPNQCVCLLLACFMHHLGLS